MRYIFANCIAAGPIDWKASLTAEHQPPIRECFILAQDTEDESFHLEMSAPSAFNLRVYSDMIAAGAVVVGHSAESHHAHLRATMIPMGIDPVDGRVHTICSMFSLTGHVPKQNGRKGWPSFDDVCAHYGITRAGTESAEDNARCLLQVFQTMQRLGIVPEPKIWKERNA